MNRNNISREINFWKIENGKIYAIKYRKQREYPGSQYIYNDFLYLIGNLKQHSNKQIFEMSYNTYNKIGKKTFILLMNLDFDLSNLITNNTIENDITLELKLLNYFNQALTSEEIDEIKKYDVYTYYHGEYEKVGNLTTCRLIEVGCKSLAILCLIHENKKVYILNDVVEYKEFRKQNIINEPSEFYDTRKNIELSYEYFRVMFSKEINEWSLDGFSPNLIERIFYCYYGIEFTKSQDKYCFRSDDTNRLNSNSGYFKNAVDNDDDYGIHEIFGKIFGYVRDAVNNYENSYKFKSYSKALCIPLFKYFGRNNNANPSLIIKKLRLNSVSINAEYHIFYWFEDADGNRYTISYLTDSPLDIIKLLNKELFLNELDQNVDVPSRYINEDEETGEFSYDLDIDNIQIQLCNFTLDVTNFNRNSLDNYFKWDTKFKRRASFKKDQEVISTEPADCEDMIIDKQETIVFVRLLYLFKIFNVEINSISWVALLNNEFEELIAFSKKEIEIISYINGYINQYIDYERSVFNDIVDLKSIKREGIIPILNFTIKYSSVDSKLPEKLMGLLEKNN